jgi:hypothetical protein
MSAIKLSPGDRVYFVQNGRKLRGVVADTLNLKTRGQKLQVPVVRPRNVKRVLADSQHKSQPKVRWLDRELVRKLP